MLSFIRIIPKVSVRHYSRKFNKRNPGIGYRKEAVLPDEDLELDETHFEGLESDFMGVHMSHKEHVEEIKHTMEKEKYHIVRQKYFKEKYPNFLTWNDKEQIRYLHSTQPEEWTIERLSEGFPALPAVIKLITKSKWKKDPAKVQAHDLAVQKNWEMFKIGKIPNLPSNLVEHLNKFTNRSLNLKPFEIPDTRKVVQVRRKNVRSEFSDIITSYEKLKNKNSTEMISDEAPVQINANLPNITNNRDTYLTTDRSKIRGRHITLQELQSNITRKG
ncbi:hypothetical protein NQ317_008380 [Molorchus minor]|uniref:Neugrin n=1 Tax=Molorchus minor TaxID=1323400 RepID=A0ABQ9K5D7_9CUCU|nr:hypothetical protein NQ317_008380 [Molorchus minor]